LDSFRIGMAERCNVAEGKDRVVDLVDWTVSTVLCGSNRTSLRNTSVFSMSRFCGGPVFSAGSGNPVEKMFFSNTP